jgi:hypothetical protein
MLRYYVGFDVMETRNKGSWIYANRIWWKKKRRSSQSCCRLLFAGYPMRNTSVAWAHRLPSSVEPPLPLTPLQAHPTLIILGGQSPCLFVSCQQCNKGVWQQACQYNHGTNHRQHIHPESCRTSMMLNLNKVGFPWGQNRFKLKVVGQ